MYEASDVPAIERRPGGRLDQISTGVSVGQFTHGGRRGQTTLNPPKRGKNPCRGLEFLNAPSRGNGLLSRNGFAIMKISSQEYIASHDKWVALLAGVLLMATPVKCAKGHWYQPDPSGKPTPCPRCQAELNKPAPEPISDDDVLAFLSDPSAADTAVSPEDSGTQQKPRKCSLKRHKKICPACHGETSYAFEYCPRCGGPLEVAVIEV